MFLGDGSEAMQSDEPEEDDEDDAESEEEWRRWWQPAPSAALRPEPFWPASSLSSLVTSTMRPFPVLEMPSAAAITHSLPLPSCPLCKEFCPNATRILAWVGAFVAVVMLAGGILGMAYLTKKVVV